MQKVLGLVALAVCAAGKTTPKELQANPAYSFEDYVQEFNKKYSGEEVVMRKAVFEANLQKIREHNAKEEESYQLGLNEYADWTEQEFKAQRTGLNKAQFFNNHHRWANGLALKTNAKVPASKDWRDHTPSVITPVKNQGGCGSCWAFSSVETIESAGALATGVLYTLAPQQLVDCSPDPGECGGTGGCEGSIQPLAFNYTIKAGGLANETSYPYKARDGTCKHVKPVVSITGQVDLKMNDGEALLEAVATVGPIAISVAASRWQLYSGGVFDSPNCGTDIDHAVQLVGYGTADGKDYWIVRNSWGPSWGEKGYIRLRRHNPSDTPCGTDTRPKDGFGCKGGPKTIQVCGMCGVLSGSSYPTGAFNVKN